MHRSLVRISIVILMVLALAAVAACAWIALPRSRVAQNCPPVSTQVEVVRSAQGDGTLVVIRANTGTVQMGLLEMQYYSVYGRALHITAIGSLNAVNYVPQYAHILSYKVTNKCGSSQQGMRLVWK